MTAILQSKVSGGNYLIQRLRWQYGEGKWYKIAYLFLQQFDLILTVLAAQLGFPEMNPLLRGLLFMPAALIVIKLIIPLLIVWLVPGRLLIPGIILLVFVNLWNLKELFVFFL